MLGTTDRSSSHDRGISVAPDEQVLATTSSMSSVLSRLPEESFENLLLISVGRHPRKVEAAVRKRGVDPASVGVIPVTGSSFSYDGPMWISKRVNPNDLTGISIQFSKGLQYVKPGHGWVCLDSISTLLMYAETHRLHRFVDSIVRRVREREARGVYAIVRDSVSEDSYEQFRSILDAERDARAPQG